MESYFVFMTIFRNRARSIRLSLRKYNLNKQSKLYK